MNRRVLMFLFLMVSQTACFSMSSTATDQRSNAEKEFARVYEEIIAPKCVSCHGNSGGVTLESYEQIITYVVPGRPELSLLYEVMADGRMPAGGPPLNADELSLVGTWISNGAGQ